jgi:hypothetical protein
MGLFVRPLGGTIILGPPLTFTRAQVERTVEVLDAALATVAATVVSNGPPDAARSAVASVDAVR